MRTIDRAPVRLTGIAAAVFLIAGCGGGGATGDAGPTASALAAGGSSALPPFNFEIRTLSNRADLVSDGDVLVEVQVPKTVPMDKVTLSLNGSDVGSAFVADPAARTFRGLVTGLALGANSLVADSNGQGNGRPWASLTITNHPRGGPILSGPQVTPFYCATPTAQPASGLAPATNVSGLSTTAVDAQCNIATETRLYYRTTTAGCSFSVPDPSTGSPPANACFRPYNPAAAAPADLATTTTDAGLTVPYIVRVERGTMNRGIYDIVVLFDPTKPWTALAPQAQWNGKVLMNFGASTGQPRRQFRGATAWTNDVALSRGYAWVQNSMTDSSSNSNRVAMSETVMMMKEHIIDRYGPVRFTIGTGCSGGSINSHMNGSINPGLLDGVTVSCAFPDSETTGIEVGDCVSLVEAYQKPQWLAAMTTAGYTQDQVNAKKAAVNGHVDQTGCHGWYNAFGSNGKVGNYNQRFVLNNATGAIGQSPTPTNNCQLPAAAVYDPVTNPTGARCSAWDWAASIFGKPAGEARAYDTRDNTGVQYGLGALKKGAITAEEFVLVNELAGGIDKDANLRAARSVGDLQALTTAYRAGIVMSGRNLAKTAVIDMRGWDDSALIKPPGAGAPPSSPIHYVWRSFSIRDRLDRDSGNHANHALWRFGRNGLLPSAAVQLESLTTMSQWLTALKADTGPGSIEQKLTAAKPAAAGDYCLLSTDATQSVKVTDVATCDADPFLKPGTSPRQVAGSPRTEDVLKCQLKPINPAEYAPAVLSAGQLARLQAVFADGVCDWSKPGVGQQDAVSPLSFAAGPGGQPLPPAPVSVARVR
jgi:hypothetical protein